MAQDEIEKIEVDTIQRKIISDFAEIYSQQTNLSNTMLKGFLWKSLREWQNKHGLTVVDTEKGSGSSPAERVQQAKQILEILHTHLLESTDADKIVLELAMRRSIRHYLSHYANR